MANTVPLVPGQQLRRPTSLPDPAQYDVGAVYRGKVGSAHAGGSSEPEDEIAVEVPVELRRGEMPIHGKATAGWFYDGPLSFDYGAIGLADAASGLLEWLRKKMQAEHVKLGDRDGDVTEASVFFAAE